MHAGVPGERGRNLPGCERSHQHQVVLSIIVPFLLHPVWPGRAWVYQGPSQGRKRAINLREVRQLCTLALNDAPPPPY